MRAKHPDRSAADLRRYPASWRGDKSPAFLLIVGMRGIGKTLLGRLAAAERGWRFIDTDVLIELWLREQECGPNGAAHATLLDSDEDVLALQRLRQFVEVRGFSAFRRVEGSLLRLLLSLLRQESRVPTATEPADREDRPCSAHQTSSLTGGLEDGDWSRCRAETPLERLLFDSLLSFLERRKKMGLLSCTENGCVVSCGGGIVESEEAMRILAREPFVVWVKATEEETVTRSLEKEVSSCTLRSQQDTEWS